MDSLSTARPALSYASATAQDAEALVALRIAAMRESLERIGRFDPVRARERFMASFVPERTQHILQSRQRIGFYVLRPVQTWLSLDHLYIQPGHQGHGVGASVLARVFVQADAQGSAVRVGVLRGSDSNRFYLRHGFALVEQGEFDNYYVRNPAPVAA